MVVEILNLLITNLLSLKPSESALPLHFGSAHASQIVHPYVLHRTQLHAYKWLHAN